MMARESGFRELLPAFASLLAAGIAAPLLLPVILTRASSRGAIFQAAVYLTLELSLAVCVGCLALMLVKPRADLPVWVSLRTFLLTAAWFAPAMVYSKLGSWWGVASGGAIAILIAKGLRDYQLSQSGRDSDNRLRFGFFAALALQGGLLAASVRQPSWAFLLMGLSCFVIAWQAPWQSSHQTKGRFAANLLLVLAILTVGIFLSRAGGGFSAPVSPVARVNAPPNLLKGVILLSEPKPHVLPSPPTLSRKSALVRQARRSPTSIPFSGEYWLFPSLFRVIGGKRVPVSQRPPAFSLVKHGDPTDGTFSSIHRWMHLVMKAHQPLDTPVDISSYGRIDVAVTNADSPPGIISMELILLDSTSGRPVSESLGEAAMPPGSAESTLRFNIPRKTKIDQFDAIEVVFNLADTRRDKSARLSIHRFDLIPGG